MQALTCGLVLGTMGNMGWREAVPGRQPTVDPGDIVEEACKLIRDGHSRTAAFCGLGVARRTFHSRYAEHEPFRLAVEYAEEQRELHLVQRLLDGTKEVLTGTEKWLLERHKPDYYAPKPAVVVQPANQHMDPETLKALLVEQGWTPPKS